MIHSKKQKQNNDRTTFPQEPKSVSFSGDLSDLRSQCQKEDHKAQQGEHRGADQDLKCSAASPGVSPCQSRASEGEMGRHED